MSVVVWCAGAHVKSPKTRQMPSPQARLCTVRRRKPTLKQLTRTHVRTIDRISGRKNSPSLCPSFPSQNQNMHESHAHTDKHNPIDVTWWIGCRGFLLKGWGIGFLNRRRRSSVQALNWGLRGGGGCFRVGGWQLSVDCEGICMVLYVCVFVAVSRMRRLKINVFP